MGGYEQFERREYWVNYTDMDPEVILMVTDILTTGGARYFEHVDISSNDESGTLSIGVVPAEALLEHPVETLDKLVTAVRRTIDAREKPKAA